MDYFNIFLVFLVSLFTIMLFDYIWLGFITKTFIIKEFGNLIVVENGSIKTNIFVGLLAWSIIAIMIMFFVTLKYDNYKDIIIYGALLGFLSYAMYDLTNLTFITNYSLKFTIVDILWGTFLCSVVSLSGYSFFNMIK